MLKKENKITNLIRMVHDFLHLMADYPGKNMVHDFLHVMAIMIILATT